MARIRTVKPEFWTSEQVVECSRDARLLFIGMWNFCDDAGRHKASVIRLKLEVLAGDAVGDAEVTRWVRELIESELLIEYEIEGELYWQVTSWGHQKIDNPYIRFPGPDGTMAKSCRRLGGKQRQLLLQKLIDRDGEKCCKCGTEQNLSLGYIVALADGGTNDPANLRIICKPCDGEMASGGDTVVMRQVRGGDAPPEGMGMEEEKAPAKAGANSGNTQTDLFGSNPEANGKKVSPPKADPRLLELVNGWIDLPQGIVKPGNGATRDRPKQATLENWNNAQRNSEQRELFADIPKLLAAIRGAKGCHGENWFTLPWLFGKNRKREWNAERILAGGHDGESKYARTNGQPNDEVARPRKSNIADLDS